MGAPESPPQEREVVEDVPLKRSVYVVFPKFRELTFSEMTVNAEVKCPRFCSVGVAGTIWNMPRKFDQDAKDRVVRLVEDRILAENMSMQAACQAVAPKLGVSWHTARQWTQAARRDGRIAEPLPEDLVAEVAKLRRENQELRDTNELLKAASAFFASELDPKRRK